MKEEFTARLLVLGMILSILAVTALAAETEVPASSLDGPAYSGQNLIYKNDAYYAVTDDTVVFPMPTAPGIPAESAGDRGAPAGTVVVETIQNVRIETDRAGQTTVTVIIGVENNAAPVEISEKAIEALAGQVKEGEAVTIVAATTASVTVPASISAIIGKTGEPVVIGNQVAEITITREISALFVRTMEIAPRINVDGTIAVSLTVDGKTVRPEDIQGGLSVRIPVSFPASSVKSVELVKADRSTVELDWKIAGGKLSVILMESGVIRVNQK